MRSVVILILLMYLKLVLVSRDLRFYWLHRDASGISWIARSFPLFSKAKLTSRDGGYHHRFVRVGSQPSNHQAFTNPPTPCHSSCERRSAAAPPKQWPRQTQEISMDDNPSRWTWKRMTSTWRVPVYDQMNCLINKLSYDLCKYDQFFENGSSALVTPQLSWVAPGLGDCCVSLWHTLNQNEDKDRYKKRLTKSTTQHLLILLCCDGHSLVTDD